MSSYLNKEFNYSTIFKIICITLKPKKIIEFGILNGFSLKTFYESTNPNHTKIEAYDIFDQFNGNCAKKKIVDQFSSCKNITIQYGDLYKIYTNLTPNIDLLHIDIANDGEVYKFVLKHYLPLLSDRGTIIFEGGSEERDHVEWMKKYNKTPINSTIKKLQIEYPQLTFTIVGNFPSVTLVSKYI